MSINIIKSIGLETLVEGTSFLDVFNEGIWKIIRVNSVYYEQELAIKDSTLNIKTFPLDNFILVLLSDITEIRNKEQEIEIKSYIIKEIHHRVKNNLQSIISLLRLQQRRNKNLEVKDILNDSIKRINSIAIVHDYLSQNDVNLVNLRDVAKNIVSGIHASFITPEKNITFKVNIPEQLHFPSSKAISFSLVLNEMLSNIIKHAFSEKDSGEVTLDIVEKGKNIIITLADTGKGIPEGFSPEKNGNLGWKIISNLVKEDLKGSYLIENNFPHGAKITLTISAYNNIN
jgi:two-component sensor histidine kinase